MEDFIASLIAALIVTMVIWLGYALLWSFIQMDWIWPWEFGKQGRWLVAVTFGLCLFGALKAEAD